MRHKPIKGLEAAQSVNIEESFSHLLDHDFDLVIELGTKHGGFSVFLAERFKRILTIDHMSFPETLKVFDGIENIIFREWDIFDEVAVLGATIKYAGRVLLLCDNGNKKREVAIFAPYLKPGDVIMAHDYARNREHFKKHIKPTIWKSLEIQDSDVVDVFKENNINFYLQEEMEKSAWLCGIKN